jgi:Helix-hairpin-helix domain/RuvA, C-terminal domain
VAAEDLAALTTVPGIGRKGAQRIVLELAGRLGSPGDGLAPSLAAVAVGAGARAPSWRDQVRAGLVSLGWQAREADQAIAVVEPELLGGLAQAGVARPGASGGELADGPDSGGQAPGAHAVQGPAPDGQVDVAVALRAALRVLGRT